MKYVMAFTGAGSVLKLDDDVNAESVSGECREAALAFMAGASAGWTKLDLVRWLIGPYARAVRHTRRGERVTGLAGEVEVSEDVVDGLVGRVRGQLLASLEAAALARGELEFLEEAIERGLVRRASDADGFEVWVPVDAPRMRLRDRLRALFAADYLAAADAYEDLLVCHRCEAVVFDPHAKQAGVCGAHRASGVVPRGDGARDSAASLLAAIGRARG